MVPSELRPALAPAAILLLAALAVWFGAALPASLEGLRTLGPYVVLALGALFGLLVPALWIITLGSAITVAQRFSKAYQEMEQIDAAERAALTLRERG